MPRHYDENSVDKTPVLQLLQEQAGHDCLAGSRIIRQEKPHPAMLQDRVIHGFDLVRQWLDLRDIDGQQRVELVGVSNPLRLDGEEDGLG